jgi:uncharacterized protein (DUF885 family)
MFSRRSALLGLGATAVAAGGGARAAAADADARLVALLSRQMDEYLALSPEAAATLLTDARGRAARRKLDDRSPAGKAAAAEAARRWRTELARVDRAALSPARQADYDCAAFACEMLAELSPLYGFQDHALRPGPYVVSQMSGAYYWLPQDFARTRVADREAGEAYLSRLAAFAEALDGETARIGIDARAGAVPPGFILDRTIAQLGDLRRDMGATLADGPAARAAPGAGEVAAAAHRILDEKVGPAIGRQMEALQALRSGASSDAGVWRLPDGAEWYALALRSNTTVATPPADMHQLGLETFAAISAELDGLLRAQGLTTGTVAERVKALDHDPRLLAPNDEAGRAQVLQFARDQLARVQALLPKAFRTLPDRDIVVERVPIAIEAGAPGAYYDGPPADGSRPGVISINLKDTAEWPTWRLKTLICHEGDPGHHLQAAVFRKAAGADLPLYKHFAEYSSYVEGWALYAEQVAIEIGAYEDDPFGRIGAVQSALFRAARIVVDTGIHHKRWSREQATRWMVQNAGEQPTSAQREIDRYCVYPGQACAFMVGRIELLRTREAARRRLGGGFDVRDFHEAVLRSGPMPMEALARVAT